MKIVIMAGGKGTRIASVQADVPKPMIQIADKPILLHQVEALRAQGYTDYIFCIGHLGHVVEEYFGDGKQFGVHISYIREETPLGTAGALYYMKDALKEEEDFLLINGDILFDIDVDRFYRYHKEKGGEVTLLTHPNSHPYDSGIIACDENGCVTRWLHKEDERLYYQNRVNAGLHFMNTRVLDKFTEPAKRDLDRDILKPMISEGTLFAYDSPEYVKDMGTPDRLEAAKHDLESGLVSGKNLKHLQKAVFLDRDGTLNQEVGFLRSVDELTLIDGVTDAVRKINESGYLAIVVTNQPVIARGEVTFETLREIHNKLETLLGMEGAYIDGLYFCPHHPNKGFEGEVAEYKIPCECRKPKPGMLLKAASDFRIDLSASYMIGDTIRDIQAGAAAGVTTCYLGDEEDCKKEADYTFANLKEAIDTIFNQEQ